MKYFKHILKYGCNAHQQGFISKNSGNIKILHGNPSYINYLDAVFSWDLISSIKKFKPDSILSTSFKHNIPTGMSLLDEKAYTPRDSFLDSRNIDPLSSFGDFIAISETIDLDAAKEIKKVVSDGIIAPNFTKEALKVLKSKKKGNYIICKGLFGHSFKYESRKINGIEFLVEKNNFILDDETLDNCIENNNQYFLQKNSILKNNCQLSFNILRNIVSNNVAIAYDNKVIAVAAGQQNRVDCIRLAGNKAHKYLERHNIDPKKADLVLASDGFLPFEDNIEECLKYNINYIIQPGGSVRDGTIQSLCTEKGITMLNTGIRMFYH